MTDRQAKLLQLIISNYIETGQPVGSQFLASLSKLELSAATLRNEMRELEQLGYLTHPHTSAGRIPTEEGYHYFVGNLSDNSNPTKKIASRLAESHSIDDSYSKLKYLAKEVSDIIDSAVIISYGKERVYYTGISVLFSQPEFRDHARTLKMSRLFDHCEERMGAVYEAFGKKQVYIGAENPLGNTCAIVGSRLPDDSLFIMLGPMRMNYQKALMCLNYLNENYESAN